MSLDKQHIINEIKRTAQINGGVALGRARFLEATGIREVDWKGKYWINWSDAVKEAGLAAGDWNKAIDEEILFEKAAMLIRELGHFPQRAELNMKRNNDNSYPSEKTFRRFGSKVFFAKAIYDWCENKQEWVDVSNICKPLRNKALESSKQIEAEDLLVNENGFVYLMKSGKYYKIGRTNSLDRRQYEIGMQLPEGIEPIHSIATDDPSGIEAYWHSRFSKKRLNGEWFDLTRQDVALFKKRKFM